MLISWVNREGLSPASEVTQVMETGIFYMGWEDYRTKMGLNKSSLSYLAKSPAHYMENLRNPSPPTPAMAKGSHFHARVLEPEMCAKTYVAAPSGINRRTKAGKEEWAAWEREHEGCIVVTQEEIDEIELMAQAVERSDSAMMLLDGLKEQSAFWKDPEYGFQCKLRADCLNEKIKMVVDLKKAADVSPVGIQRAIANFSYHWQHAWYLKGLEIAAPGAFEGFAFVFVEDKPPYTVLSRIIDPGDIEIAHQEIEPLLKLYAECLEKDRWPGPPDEIEIVGLPRWYKNHVIFN